jgi:hypothetical protein
MVRQILNIEKAHLVCQVRKSVFVKYAVSRHKDWYKMHFPRHMTDYRRRGTNTEDGELTHTQTN